MKTLHIDDFHDVSAETFMLLYAAFPVRHMLLVEDISGPIKWDMTGLPDRKSRATFETIIWLADHGLLNFRSVEPRDVGVEGAVLTQRAYVLLTGSIRWDDGEQMSRIDALRDARRRRAYADVATILGDLFNANCRWSAPAESAPLTKTPPIDLSLDDSRTDGSDPSAR